MRRKIEIEGEESEIAKLIKAYTEGGGIMSEDKLREVIERVMREKDLEKMLKEKEVEIEALKKKLADMERRWDSLSQEDVRALMRAFNIEEAPRRIRIKL